MVAIFLTLIGPVVLLSKYGDARVKILLLMQAVKKVAEAIELEQRLEPFHLIFHRRLETIFNVHFEAFSEL